MARERAWTLGIVCILCVAIIWGASSVVVQAILSDPSAHVGPFFLTFLANSLFMVMLPVRAVTLFFQRRLAPEAGLGLAAAASSGALGSTTADADDGAEVRGRIDSAPEPADSLASPMLRVWRSADLRAGLVVAPVWFLANLTYNMGLGLTSITSSTVISSSSSAFTLLLSAAWLGERLTPLKLAGVASCWTGNALTALDERANASAVNATAALVHALAGGDGLGGGPPPLPPPLDSGAPAAAPAGLGVGSSVGSDGGSALMGDVLALLSAMLYAVYTVMIRKLNPTDLSLFFGMLGTVTHLLAGPVCCFTSRLGEVGLASRRG